MKIAVAMPWRPSPARMPAHDRAVALWRSTGIEVVERDSDPGLPFHRSEARNRAVRDADADVVVVADADSIPEIPRVRWATVAVQTHLRDYLVYPFDRYVAVPADAVLLPDLSMATPNFVKDGRDVDNAYAAGGVFVIRTELYWSLGGMDERFERKWGFEDNAFYSVAKTLAGVTRCAGTVYSIDHADAEREYDGNENAARLKLYQFAEGQPDVMRELIK